MAAVVILEAVLADFAKAPPRRRSLLDPDDPRTDA